MEGNAKTTNTRNVRRGGAAKRMLGGILSMFILAGVMVMISLLKIDEQSMENVADKAEHLVWPSPVMSPAIKNMQGTQQQQLQQQQHRDEKVKKESNSVAAMIAADSLSSSSMLDLTSVPATEQTHEIMEKERTLHSETELSDGKATVGTDNATAETNTHSIQEQAEEKEAEAVNNAAKELAAVAKIKKQPEASMEQEHVANTDKQKELLVPDYVGCFERVKTVLNSTTKTNSFCEAPCVQELRHYLNKEGMDLSRFQPMKRHPDKSPRGSILVNSPGGVGSTFFMDMLPGLNYSTNNRSDRDRLKHLLPFDLLKCSRKKGSPPCRAVLSNQSRYEDNVRGKYNAMINVFGSSAHAIFSLYSRGYENAQYKKLNPGSTLPETWYKNAPAIFDASAKTGSDVFGIGKHAHQWMDLQDIVTFGFCNKTLAPELQPLRLLSNSSDDYLQGVVKDFPPIFFTDITTTRAAPAVFAALLGVTVEELESVSRSTQNGEKSNKNKKLTKEQEHEIVKTAGATQIYARLEQEMQHRIKQNYLLFGVAMFCSTSSSNTL